MSLPQRSTIRPASGVRSQRHPDPVPSPPAFSNTHNPLADIPKTPQKSSPSPDPTLIIHHAKTPRNVLASPVGQDIMASTQSYPLKFRQLKYSNTRSQALIANGYPTRYCEIRNCSARIKMTPEDTANIASRDDLADFIDRMLTDYSTSGDQWENQDIPSFLEAFQAWLQSSDGYYNNQKIDLSSVNRN